MENIKVPKMWTITEAAAATNMATCFVRRLISENKIKYIKAGKKYLINAESLCDFLTKCDRKEE